MKLHIMSDLHLAGCGMKPLTVQGQVLILAGDISDGLFEKVLALTQAYREAGLPILYVLGNHEFEGNTMSQELRFLRRACRENGITLMHNRTVYLGGIRFVGSTLWTDFTFGGNQDTTMHLASYTMCDYQKVNRTVGKRLTPADTLRFHDRAYDFLARVLARPFEGPTVVITHHGVSPKSIHAHHAGNSLNGAYVTNLTAEIKTWKPALMIHGHVHNQFDYPIGDTRVVVNPRGRVDQIEDRDGSILELVSNDQFDKDMTIEI